MQADPSLNTTTPSELADEEEDEMGRLERVSDGAEPSVDILVANHLHSWSRISKEGISPKLIGLIDLLSVRLRRPIRQVYYHL